MNIQPQPLTAKAFAPFGEVIEMEGGADFLFNDDRAERWHDQVRMEVDETGRIGVSLCRSKPVAMPYKITIVERHPLASQAFIPLNDKAFLVVVALDQNGKPSTPQAFLTNGTQGINYARNTWHGVLTPLNELQDFVVIDRVEGKGENLEVFHYPAPFLISPE